MGWGPPRPRRGPGRRGGEGQHAVGGLGGTWSVAANRGGAWRRAGAMRDARRPAPAPPGRPTPRQVTFTALGFLKGYSRQYGTIKPLGPDTFQVRGCVHMWWGGVEGGRWAVGLVARGAALCTRATPAACRPCAACGCPTAPRRRSLKPAPAPHPLAFHQPPPTAVHHSRRAQHRCGRAAAARVRHQSPHPGRLPGR